MVAGNLAGMQDRVRRKKPVSSLVHRMVSTLLAAGACEKRQMQLLVVRVASGLAARYSQFRIF